MIDAAIQYPIRLQIRVRNIEALIGFIKVEALASSKILLRSKDISGRIRLGISVVALSA